MQSFLSAARRLRHGASCLIEIQALALKAEVIDTAAEQLLHRATERRPRRCRQDAADHHERDEYREGGAAEQPVDGEGDEQRADGAERDMYMI